MAVDERPDQGAGLERIAHPHRRPGLLQAHEQRVGDVAMHDQPAQRGAALPGGAHGAEQDRAHGQIEVGRRRDDHRVVAAQLEQAAAEAGGHARADLAAHAGRAGRAHQRHAGMIDQRHAGLAPADYDLHQVRRRLAEARRGALEQRPAGQRGERRLLRRLPHHRVAAHQGQRGVPGPYRGREVERADHAHHPERVPSLHHAVAGALGGHGQAVELARQAEGEIADVDHLLDFAQALLEDLAGLEGDQAPERILVRAQLLAEQAHQLAAPRGGHAAPLEEGALRRAHGRGHLGRPLHGQPRQRAAVDRRDHAQLALGQRGRFQAQGAQQFVHAFSIVSLTHDTSSRTSSTSAAAADTASTTGRTRPRSM